MRANTVYTIVVCACIAVCRGAVTANDITVENSLAGLDNWLHAQQDPGKKLEIDGFTSNISYFPAEIVHFKMSSQPWATAYRIEIYRLGYYNGLGARQVGEIHMTKDVQALQAGRKDTFEILVQPACLFDKESRLTDCSNWQNTAAWSIPSGAVSGVYVALPIHDGQQKYYGSYIPFVVKKVVGKDKKVDMLFKTADTTWVAYNRYGDYNLYRGTSNAWSVPATRAFKASYNRPYTSRMVQPLGYEVNFIFGAEYPMLYWLEKHGYDVSYSASQDVETMHQDGTLLQYKTILSVGHDEYWTQAMKAAHEYARDQGVNLAFFSGNEVFWRIVWDEDTQKNKQSGENVIVDSATNQKMAIEPKRVYVCRKESSDAVAAPTPEDWTGTFRDPRFRPADPESLLTGQNFMVNGIRNDAMTVTAEDAELRFWWNATFAQVPAGANLLHDLHSSVDWTDAERKHQDRIVYTSAPGLLGYEWDVFPTTDGRHAGLIPLSTSHIELQNFLIENYGTSFGGSGIATHRLSLYRQYNYAPSSVGNTAWTLESACSAPSGGFFPKPKVQSTSLVFGAGTVQWSWALSSKRDGWSMPEDRDIQQATLNLFADMGVFPASFVADMTPPLAFPAASTDTFPPASSIAGAHQKDAPEGAVGDGSIRVEVRGRAKDDERGGGNVAAVEVSADGGQTWVMAVGRRHWHHTFVLSVNSTARPMLPSNSISDTLVNGATRWMRSSTVGPNGLHCVTKLGDDQSAGQQCTMLILSRAVDDSGWQEEVDALSGLCTLQRSRDPAEWKHILGRDGKTRVRNARIVEITL